MTLNYLLLTVVLLQVCDFATTAYGLGKGKATEANPLLAKLMDSIGVWPTLVLTKGLVAGLAVYLWTLGSLPWLIILAIAYAATVLNNVRVIRHIRR